LTAMLGLRSESAQTTADWALVLTSWLKDAFASNRKQRRRRGSLSRQGQICSVCLLRLSLCLRWLHKARTRCRDLFLTQIGRQTRCLLNPVDCEERKNAALKNGLSVLCTYEWE
jgi:hypothetical protein